jgi:metal-responsive CopG/Arc/MetJ family transcriptional regulator
MSIITFIIILKPMSIKVGVGLALSQELVKHIDAKRGLISRSAYVEHLLRWALDRYQMEIRITQAGDSVD